MLCKDGWYCGEFTTADRSNEKAFDFPSHSDSNQMIFGNIVVQYVLSEEHQILVCETSTILFAFCGTSLQNQPTWSYCGRMYPSPRLDEAYSSSCPNTMLCGSRKELRRQPSTICLHIWCRSVTSGYEFEQRKMGRFLRHAFHTLDVFLLLAVTLDLDLIINGFVVLTEEENIIFHYLFHI